MKLYIRILFYTLFVNISYTHACEICGCGGSNTYLGLFPDFKTKFIGLRYNHQYYKTVLSGVPDEFSNNYYNTIELWGGLNIGKKWNLMGFVPFRFNEQAGDDGTSYINGFGDVTILTNYKLWNKASFFVSQGVLQQIWVGGGVKLPTGKYEINVKDPSTSISDINSQLGTGTVDFLFNLMYNVKLGNLGVNTTFNYKVNTTKDEYIFGNKFTFNSICYYRIVCNNRTYISMGNPFVFSVFFLNIILFI